MKHIDIKQLNVLDKSNITNDSKFHNDGHDFSLPRFTVKLVIE